MSGKKRRLTIIECGCDINMMIDLAKAADLDEVGPTHELVQTFFSTHSTKMASSRVMLFSGSKPLGSENIDNHGVRDGFGFPVLCAPVWLLNPAGEVSLVKY
ncbi:arf-GAP with GTPase, ANK repeat and PH domain-containing protein 9-like isoform X3 [Macaca fascicularis]|uniref:arf-GAP with GTPase, ANK repeat and PH domain-containing protein 9-like isoform X3 n=1 Tax=Macaca fascicularis TaxID=9541 RepID=UPI0032B03348